MERDAKRYVLLDRDGTVIVEKHYLSDPTQVELLPGAGAGLRMLQENGFGLILITNQSGVGRGLFTESDLDRVNKRLEVLLEREGVKLDAIYSCPHTPEDRCECRKPKTKLVLDAALDFGFHPENAWMVGDKAADVNLARNSGAKAILVRTGYGRETERKGVNADFIVDELEAAAAVIIANTCK